MIEEPTGSAPEDFKRNRRKPSFLADPLKEDLAIPHSIEGEQGVLGCILLSPLECLAHCQESIRDSSAFYDLRHRTIYEALLAMESASIKMDLITIQQFLKDRHQLEGVGGLAYIASLPDAVPSAANLDYYLEIVLEKHVLRNLISTCTEIVSRACEHHGEVDELLASVENDITGICRQEKKEQQVTASSGARAFIHDMDARVTRKGPTGIITGFQDLDRLTDGIQLGEQFIIGARPSIGKTAIGLNIMMKACLLDNIPAIFISLEQSHTALLRRLASAYTHVNMHHIKTGNLTDEEQKRLCDFSLKYKSSKAVIYDFVSTGASASMIASVVRREARRGCKLVIIDYLQKVKSVSKQEKRTYEVGEVSGILRAAAVEAKVAMVTLAQLNRENEKEKGRPPRLADLADSGQIERDADMVGLLHRDRSLAAGPATLCIAKQRDGETGVVNLHFNGRYCEFTNGTLNECP